MQYQKQSTKEVNGKRDFIYGENDHKNIQRNRSIVNNQILFQS